MKQTFTILDSDFIGLGPAADYTSFMLNDDAMRGGYARRRSSGDPRGRVGSTVSRVPTGPAS